MVNYGSASGYLSHQVLKMQMKSILFVSALFLCSATNQEPHFLDVTEEVLPPYQQFAPFSLQPTKTPMPSGVCTLDIDNDGYPDLYFVSGQDFPNALMRNKGDGTFEDVTEAWGLEHSSSSAVSCLAADLDNDGCEDLLLAGAYTGGDFTGNLLLRSLYCDGEGVTGFEDKTPDVLRQHIYSVSAQAGDIDNDGLLDIYVSSLPPVPSAEAIVVPLESFPAKSLLLHNKGNFEFEDISESSGAARAICPCITVFMDFNYDNLIDIVAMNCGNDLFRTWDAQLYRNNGDLTFTEIIDSSAFGPFERKGMWMGSGVADFNGDGCLDIATTNLATDFLYPNNEHSVFLGQACKPPAPFPPFVNQPFFYQEDVRLAPPQEEKDVMFAWGPSVRDFDNDGKPDMFISGNYYVDNIIVSIAPPGTSTPGEVLYSVGDTGYEFRSEDMPIDLSYEMNFIYTSGDYNGDGFPDIVVSTEGSAPDVVSTRKGRPVVFYNNNKANNNNKWLGIKLVGHSGVNRQGVGAVARLYRYGGAAPEQTLLVLAGSGSMSTEEKTLFFGLGMTNANRFTVEITWPGGKTEWFGGFNESKIYTLTLGEGTMPGACDVCPASSTLRKNKMTDNFLSEDADDMIRCEDLVDMLAEDGMACEKNKKKVGKRCCK